MTFAKAMMALRHWMERSRIVQGRDDERVKITIEVSTPEMGMALQRTLKRELDPLVKSPFSTPIDLDRQFRFMGMDVEFKLMPQYGIGPAMHAVRELAAKLNENRS